MRRLKEKSKNRIKNDFNSMQCECSENAVALVDYIIELTGPLAIKAAWRSAVSANLVDPWLESFEELTTSDKMKVLAHCVCMAYGKIGPQQVQSIERFDPVG
jgi:hypothetical protein